VSPLPRYGVGQLQGGRRHGLSVKQIEAMRHQQRGRCAICLDDLPPVPFVDHDHVLAAEHPHPVTVGCRACVRGLLCNGCNLMLGHAKDDVTVLLAGVTYLKMHRAVRS
jgi:hypothetical protein